ncbi:MAG: GtrA family protein [Lachnospiraceae bacterium]|nr:GtrA family protein [Lachnospiraceae bacterium]
MNICKNGIQKCCAAIKNLVFARYIISGLFFTGIEYSTYYLLVSEFNINYIIANIIVSFSIGSLAFLSKNYLVFSQKSVTFWKVAKYIFNSVTTTFLGSAVLWFFGKIAKFDFLFSKLFTTALFFLANFFLQRNYVFIELGNKNSIN